MSGRNNHKVWALFHCLPDGFCRLYSVFLCNIIFCKNYPPAFFPLPRNCKRNVPQQRLFRALYRGKKIIAVTVQNYSVFYINPSRIAKYMQATLKSIAKGTPIMNIICLVLCLKICIPKNAPKPPSKNAKQSKVLSLTLCFPFIALYLSNPYTAKTTAFQIIKFLKLYTTIAVL